MTKSMAAALICLAIPLVFADPASGESKKLNSEELTALYEGGFTIEHRKGWKAIASSDGTMLFKSSFIDRGNWRIDGDEVCTRWRKIRSGAELCSNVEIDGDTYIWVNSKGKKDRAQLTR